MLSISSDYSSFKYIISNIEKGKFKYKSADESISKKDAKKITIDTVKWYFKEAINEKLNNKDATDILPRLVRFCNIKESELDEVANIKKVFQVIEKLEISGSALQFGKENAEFKKGDVAGNFIKYIFSGKPLSSDLISMKLFKALIINKDNLLLIEVRENISDYLKQITEFLKKASPHEEKIAEILIGNILALYPFFEPTEGSILALPQKINNEWVNVEYKIDLIQMTSEWKGDPYYACGFMPLNNKHALPHLSFMGTPPPTTRGVLHAELTDFIPGHSVGETLYNEGKVAIEQWVLHATTETGKKLNLYGQSLGGSLSMILTANQPEHIGKIYTYNPPGLWKSLLNQYQKNVNSIEKSKRPEMNVFCQENDPVYSLGAGWDPDWNVYQVVPENPTTSYEAHIHAFSGRSVTFLKMTEKEIKLHNTSVARRIYNMAMEILRVPLFLVKSIALAVQIIKHTFKKRNRVVNKIKQRFLLKKYGPT